MSYLLGITIGPVQSFIEESKKLKDLYNSSRIIVEIMNKLYNYFKDSELIYPQVNAEQHTSFTNYLIVKVESNNLDISSLLDDVYKDLLKDKDLKEDLKENFNCFWAYEEINSCEDENKEYKRAYNNLTRLISSLKNTYEFDNNSQEADHKKCRLCGKRNIDNEYRYDELCSLCGFKRNYIKTDFPSVYNMPSENILRENEVLKANGIVKKNNKYLNLNIVENLIVIFDEFCKSINGEDKLIKDILKDSQYKDYRFEMNKLREFWCDLNKPNEMKLGNAVQKLKDLRKILIDCYKDGTEPNFEYAFIKYDVDNLGKWMSGKFIKKNIDLKNFQKDLSSWLCTFSDALKQEIDDKCTVIYAGGDDFLAICSCEKIFEIINSINKIFEEKVSNRIKKYTFKNISYSMSITIAQCKDPMNYALRKNRVELENVKSKFEPDKDAVAFTYIVNNGKEICCYIGKEKMSLLEKVLRNYKTIEDNMSLSYTRSFSKEFKSICDKKVVTFDKYEHIYDISLLELRRIMSRSSKVDDKRINDYIDAVHALFKSLYKAKYTKLESNTYLIDITNIANLFELINHLSDDKYYEIRE